MSSTLYYKPIIEKEYKYFSDHIKWMMQKKFDVPWVTGVILSKHDIVYFSGLVDAGVEGAQKVIDAINKYGTIKIWEEA